jgi:3-deoxy-manno-octulosonate cytidylyltransferase (CMP-KDO synthetase)
MSSRQRVVVIIPSRYASQRLSAKPLADIAGKPMIQHVWERARRATLVDAVIVATDDERIAAAVRGFGGTVVMTPASCQSGTDRIAHAARNFSDADIVVNVQGDEPLLEPSMIDEAVRPILNREDLSVVTLVRRIESPEDLSNPNIVKVVLAQDGRCLYFSRSPIPFGRDEAQSQWLTRHDYYKHIGLYVFRRDVLLQYASMEQTPLELMEKLEQLRILERGLTILAVVTSGDSIPVDTAADLDRVRSLIGATR